MLTVLQVSPALDTGGVERTTVDLARAIVAAGGRALVASAGGRLEGDLAAAGGELVRLPVDTKNPVEVWRNAGRLARVITAEGVDIVHARSRAPAWSALWAARRTGAACVATYHGIYNARSAAKRFYNGVMARGDLTIANSAYTADHVAAAHGVARERIAVVYPGLDTRLFDPAAVSEDRKRALRQAWGLVEHIAPIVLLPGRLTRWKGQLVLIEALTHLARDGRLGGAVGVLVGDDQGRTDYRAEVAAAIGAAGLAGKIVIAGHCADIPAAYALADVVVSASIEPEAFGRVAAEAQAMGVPVVATDHGGATESVVVSPASARTGWRVPPGDAAAMAGAVAAALHLPTEERGAMAVRARAWAVGAFDNDAMCARTLKLYGDLLEQRR